MIDPFAVKRHSKLNPARFGYTAYARAVELISRGIFPKIEIPEVTTGSAEISEYQHSDTAVTPPQMGALVNALRSLPENVTGPVVEIGSYRGVTTRMFAQNTSRKIFAVDPFQGYGGAEGDFALFKRNVVGLPNIIHLRATSGKAAKDFQGPVAFIFVDAVHDYVNSFFDATIWSAKLSKGGLMAMHDVDNPRYAGTHIAAWRMSKKYDLVCHIDGLVIVRKL